MTKKTTSTIIRNIDSIIWKKFKRICFDEGISLNKKLKQMIEKATQRGRGQS